MQSMQWIVLNQVFFFFFLYRHVFMSKLGLKCLSFFFGSIEITWIKYFASISFFTCRECNSMVLDSSFFLFLFRTFTGKVVIFIKF